MKLRTRAFQHHLPARRPGARPVDRRHHHADLPDVHLRPGRARQAQGLRVRAHAESDAHGARAQHRGDRRRQGGFAFASGMAAIDAIATLLKSGDHVVVSDNTYGGTFRLFDKVLTPVPAVVHLRRHRRTSSDTERAITPATRMLFVETPTNPVMRLTDLRAGRRARASARRAARRRQHVRQPVHPAADRVRRRPRHAQHDEVPERPQRQRRRRRRRAARRRHRVAEVRAERRGRDSRAVRFVAGAARHQDAAAPDGAAQRQRPGARRVPRARIRRCSSVLSRACRRIRSTRWRRGRCAASAACSRSISDRSRPRGVC